MTYYCELCIHRSYTGGIVTDFGLGDLESIYDWDLNISVLYYIQTYCGTRQVIFSVGFGDKVVGT